MNHALSTHFIVNHRLTTSWLDRIRSAGITQVEIFCGKQHVDWENRAQIMELQHWFSDADLKLHALHAPMYTDEVWGRTGPNSLINICETLKGRRMEMVDHIKRTLEIAEYIPCKYLIQHLGVSGEEYDEHKLDAAFSSLDEIVVFGKQRGVSVLLENIPNGMSSAERLVGFLQMTHLNLGFCFDVGHAHMNEGIEPAFEIMKERIRSTHIHDNDGKDDKHVFPMVADGGTIDWKKTMALLRSREQQYPLLLELKENPEFKHPLETVQEIFERLENV
jgi:sugar phosphate isomerase/epimerase